MAGVVSVAEDWEVLVLAGQVSAVHWAVPWAARVSVGLAALAAVDFLGTL